ncbi:MAG TPA: SusC/RagA family TonB-linked outer membrane protein [Gemmatimonadaceae bacterium]|nr:SusC/RagA family TonB-linked outer membrane protein [Gemmatimonadaceae bacterium]
MRRRTIASLAAFLACAPIPLLAQTREITGKVVQAGTGTPITEATIGIVGAQLGVRTNERGEYRLKVPSGDAQILVRAIGFKRQQKVVASSQSTVDFELEKDVLQLEGVTVTGQATTVDKRNASTAIASVSAEDIVAVPAKTIDGALQGKIVGATVSENSGVPGGGFQIQIRGATSINASGDPLFIVDGVIYSNNSINGGLASISRSSGSTSSTQDQTVNRLADLNPNDIENIEVLKSAAATAIYGSRATNGVVVITTKRGKAGQNRYNITQRLGTQQPIRLLGSRHFADYATVKPYLGTSPHADSIAKANCTPACPWYDWQSDLYNNTTPAFETVISSSGGVNATRYYASLNDRQNHGIEQNTGARRTSGRLNLDQTMGDKWTISAGLDITHNFVQDGIGNNDNAGISPNYTFGYAPAIYDIQKIDPVTGRLVYMWMNGGGTATSNPFDVVHSVENNEDTWRQTGNVRLGYSLMSSVKNQIQLTYIGGVDRFQFQGDQYAPNFLQFEGNDGFLGTSQQNTTDSRFINQSINAVWTFSPGWRFFNSLQSSFGGTYETQRTNNYNIRARGLLPTRVIANQTGSTDFSSSQSISDTRDQSKYFNEQFIGFDEKLALGVGARADRGSNNGDRNKFYSYPKYSASYRFVEPLSKITSKVDELKLRASYGQSGNRPNFGVRDVTIASGGVIGGLGSLSASSTLGNPAIKPEVMNETEWGADIALFRGRVSGELSRYQRVIKDLLVSFPLPQSSGLGSQTINGGQLSSLGFEAGINVVPISTRDMEWTLRTTYQHNRQYVDKLLVPAFGAPGGSFAASYGRNRITTCDIPTLVTSKGVKYDSCEPGSNISTLIWGNVPFSCLNSTDATTGKLVVNTGTDGLPCHRIFPGDKAVTGQVVRDSIIADAAPLGQTSFLNTFRYKKLTVSGLIDWRIGSHTSDMTKNLFDEGGNSRDYDDSSPDAAKGLGAYRYSIWAANNIAPYIDLGTFVKLREVNVTFDAPAAWAQKVRAREVRISVQARNLGMKSNYWSFDPEFNNFGNQNFNRFIDLAPYPTNRQFFFSVDLGY